MIEYCVVPPEEQHVLFEYTQRGLPGFALVNTALKCFEPKAAFAWNFSVLIPCKDLTENRLPSREEQRLLFDFFENKLDTSIKRNGNALFLARVTHDALREVIWRVRDPAVVNAYLQEVIRAGGYPRPFDYRMEEDREWGKVKWYLDQIPWSEPIRENRVRADTYI